MCIAGYNSCGVGVTKYASGTARATIKTACTVLVWILSSLFIPGAKWEPWSGVGFLMLSFGTFVYNEMIIIPYLGFDQWTKQAIKAREEAKNTPNDE